MITRDFIRKVAKKFLEEMPKDKSKLVRLSDFLNTLYTLYKKEDKFRNFILSPFVSLEQKESFLKALLERESLPTSLVMYFTDLIRVGGFKFVGEIKRVYDYEMEKLLATYKAYLFLPYDIEKDKVEKIIKTVEKKLNRSIEPEIKIEKSLIGGFVLKMGGFVIDSSIKKQLFNLENRLVRR